MSAAPLSFSFSVCAISGFAPLQPRFGTQREESMIIKELVSNFDFRKERSRGGDLLSHHRPTHTPLLLSKEPKSILGTSVL